MRHKLLLIAALAGVMLPVLPREAPAEQSAAPEKAKETPAPTKARKKAPAKSSETKPPPAPAPAPAAMPPPVVEVMPMDLPPPVSDVPPAPTPPGSGSIAAGITPVHYGAPTPGSSRLVATVPVLPPKPAPAMGNPAGAGAGAVSAPPPSPAPMTPAVAKVTPYTPPVFMPPVPPRKPVQAQAPAREAMASAGSPAVTAGLEPLTPAKPGYTAVVPITPFGTVPEPQQPASQPAPEPITFTVRLPTIVMLEPKP